ncbi:hypothetical protein [Parageobacillus thermoglucosidasius]|uniref:Uncharacterized protein n=2 Tax=Parageobacillus thermoglucosidasius TaxID=1426 RepID=A0AB38QZG3_PARTM|nr:hypothetical protein [Parageobacillus thermoglucosidasius]UOE76743.1 hypothetical protein IMI45_02280 [Parageobacillus thermoglucosidasius]
MPLDVRKYAAPVIVLMDPATVGFFIVGAAVLLERSQGVLDPLFVAPAQLQYYICSKALTLGLLGVVSGEAMLVFASNRLEGLAVAKMLNLVLLPPIVLYFFAAKWRLFGLLVPTYWVSEAVLALAEENVKFWGYWLGGTAYHLLCICCCFLDLTACFIKRFDRLSF